MLAARGTDPFGHRRGVGARLGQFLGSGLPDADGHLMAQRLQAGAQRLTHASAADDCCRGAAAMRGLAYQISAAKFGHITHPVHQAAVAVKQRVMGDLTTCTVRQGFADPAGVAGMVFLLRQGVWAARCMFGPAAPLDGAGQAVRRLTQQV